MGTPQFSIGLFGVNGQFDPVTLVAMHADGDATLDLVVGPVSGVQTYLGTGTGSFTVGPFGANPGACLGSTHGDFNGDGNQDVALMCNTLRVGLGDGLGAFQITSHTSSGGAAVVATDLDSNGRADLCVANSTATLGANVFMNAGDGTFRPPTWVDAGAVDQIASFDFNGDGKQDLAVQPSNDLPTRFYLGNGDGGFSPAPASPPCGATLCRKVALGDFDNDGKVDLVTRGDSTVSKLSFQRGVGDGTFAVASVRDEGGTTNVRDIVAADMNGDGALDLVSVETGNGLYLALGAGDGGFGAKKAYSTGITGTGAKGIAVGDFNGDGKLDLALGTYGTVGGTIRLTRHQRTGCGP